MPLGVPSERRAHFIAIASGKGGVGKTNFSINLGILLAKAGKRVLIMDMDLGLGNVQVILGINPKYNLYHVIKGQKKIGEIISESPYGVRIIAGASGFSKLADLTEDERVRFMDEISGISDSDYVIIDTGAGVSRNVLSFVLSADEAIILTTPEPTAITDAYGIIKAISTEDGQSVIKLVVNCASSVSEGGQVAKRVIDIAGQFLNVRVENLGFIYYDQAVLASVMKQKPYVLAEPTSRAAECMDLIARKLLDMPPADRSGGFGDFLRNLLFRHKED
jgi:flagellar biosynthesis protein FlhG